MKKPVTLSKTVFVSKVSKSSRLIKIMLFAVILTGGLFAQTEPVDSDGDGKREVSTLDHLLWISQNSSSWGYDYEQTANIDTTDTKNWDSGAGFSPIGNSDTTFTGSYDGQNHTINALYISRSASDYIGLFGYTDNANISNLGLTNVDITGHSYTGGLKGYNYNTTYSYVDTIVNCYSTGSVSGYTYVGGLIGYNAPGEVNNCYSTCSVSGPAYIGGFVGYTERKNISNCYSTGSISGGGGFIAANGGTVTSCFWDTLTSGMSSSDAGTGKTTSQMKALATFTDEDSTGLTTAWDFVTNPNDDVANDDIWDMDLSGTINSGYPYLSWQDGSDQSLPVELASFTAVAGNGRVTLQWTTESEIENLGFNIYRSRRSNGQFTRINNHLIPGAGSSSTRHEYEYTDNGVMNGVTYWYKLEDVDYRGSSELHGPVSATPVKGGAPGEFCLNPNYPNPFNPVTTIAYDLPEECNVQLTVFDLSGRKIKTLLSGRQESGSYQINWDGTDQMGELVASGVYFLSISSDNYSKTHKMVFVR